MVNIIKEEIIIEESLESRLRVICDFCNTTPTIINGSIRRIDKNIKDLELLQQQINNDKLLIENKYINYVIIDNRS